MDNSVLSKILREEADLVKQKEKIDEDLRFLREFKARFFEEHPTDTANTSTKKRVSGVIKQKRNYKRRGVVTLADRVISVLNTIGSGMLPDVTKKFIELNPKVDAEKAYKDCKYQLSKLYREGKITGEKVNGKKGYLFKPINGNPISVGVQTALMTADNL